MFLKRGCSEKFRNIHRKPSVLESLFNTIVKGNSSTGIFVNIEKHLQTAAFES